MPAWKVTFTDGSQENIVATRLFVTPANALVFTDVEGKHHLPGFSLAAGEWKRVDRVDTQEPTAIPA